MSKPVVFVTRKAQFNAAHKLYNPNWSEEKNNEVFGKCANKNWHGHNFDLYVTIKGRPHQDTGFVMDLKKLKTLIEENVIEKLDHKNLNLDVEMLKGEFPSIENIVIAIWNVLTPLLPENAKLHQLRLWETERNYVDYYGPDIPF